MEALSRRESSDGRIEMKPWLKADIISPRASEQTAISTAVLMEQATQHFLKGKLEDTERVCRQILLADGHHAGSLNLLGMIAYQRRSYDTAIQYHRRAIALEKNNAYYQSNLGGALEAKGELQEAVIRYASAILLKPDLAEAHYNLANVLRAQEKRTRQSRATSKHCSGSRA